MIKIEKIKVEGFEPAIRGMRNPVNSWNKSDSFFDDVVTSIGNEDRKLALRLAKEGSPNRKFLRMITVWMDITAPLYWWKEFDTYKVGTVADSCSTMHKIHSKLITEDDFSTEHLSLESKVVLSHLISYIEDMRGYFQTTGNRDYWWQIIQLLPSSYNQRRTVMLNYETLTQIYKWRRNHKLDEWRHFCKMIETLPYSELITSAED